MKDELKTIIETAYKQAREVMQAHKGKWTVNGKKANQAFRALEVACRKLGIPTPPINKRPESKVQPFTYSETKPEPEPTTEPGDFIAANRQQQLPMNDVLRPKAKRK